MTQWQMMLIQASAGVWEARRMVWKQWEDSTCKCEQTAWKAKGGRHTMAYHSQTDTHSSEPLKIHLCSFLPWAKWMSKILVYKNKHVLWIRNLFRMWRKRCLSSYNATQNILTLSRCQAHLALNLAAIQVIYWFTKIPHQAGLFNGLLSFMEF